MSIAATVGVTSLACLGSVLWYRNRSAQREKFIREFLLPKGLFEALCVHHPHLTPKDCHLVSQGLRQFFLAHLKSGGKFVSMPSQVVDDLWHEFILYTRAYEVFCKKAFGHMLHHTPAVVLRPGERGNQGIRRAWHFACQEENINPRHPSRLPLLFALDSKLDIPNGFIYMPDCGGFSRKGDQDAGGGDVYCGAGLAGGDGSSDSSAGNNDGDGGSDCGGGGCGGGGD